MKNQYLYLPALLLALLFTNVARAQYPEWNDPNSLPIWMTPEEKLRRHEIGLDFVPTSIPPGEIHNIAEHERMQAALIRYPLGIPLNLVAAMSQHVKVITLVSSTTVQNQAINSYQSAGVNMENCQFLIAPTDSYWTRDYGPWFITTGENQVAIVDFPYDRPRPNDNQVPSKVAAFLNVPLYAMNVVHTGGNYMTDGWGISASTDLVYEENNNNVSWVNQQMHDYLGIDTYHVTLDPLGDYIKHIDCWGKFLDVDKIIITEVPVSNPRYQYFEQVANYFANQISAYGTPFQVYRVYSPNGQPYTNSLILNHRVYVPITGSSNDAAAIAKYQEAMPGYEVLGFTGSWLTTDALHCRVKDIADIGMLYIKHMPIVGEQEYQPFFEISAEMIPYSGSPLYTDSLFVIYKKNMGSFDTIPLVHHQNNTYKALIPASPDDNTISYYLSAADQSGRRETFPFIGAAGARSFTVVQTIIPGDSNCDGVINLFDVIAISNYLIGFNPEPFCFENADINGDGIINIQDLIDAVNLILSKTD